MAYVDENLNDPTKYFTAYLWTGDGNSPRSFTGVGFQANMMWSKLRSAGHEHSVVDTVRGVDNRRLKTDTNAAEDTTNTHGHFDSLDSDGFTVTGASGYWNVNTSGQTYVGWFWKESADAGFDIVSYTGNATNRTISHSLSAVPHWMVVKNRDSAVNWTVYHHKNTSAPETDRLLLNTNGATGDSDAEWNDTAPTSSVFSVGTGDSPNKSGDAIIAYLWSEKQGFSKFGSFVSTNTSNNAFIYTGFAPAMVITKSTTSTNNWVIQDIKRPGHNPAAKLYPDLSNDEDDDNDIDFLSNGFKMRGALGANTFVYAAFAEAPFVNSNGVPCNAK